MEDLLQYYGQYLIVCQTNYTLTHLAEHSDGLSHDRINRFLALGEAGPADVWAHVHEQVEWSPNGYLLFDDTVLDKTYSRKIEGVRRQYSGNVHGIVRGIGVVQCVYYNAETGRFWVIDYRVFDPEHDGKDKLDHVWDMLSSCENRGVKYQHVLMDSWYATAQMFKRLEGDGKTFYCPLKRNRQVYEPSAMQEEPQATVEETSKPGRRGRSRRNKVPLAYQAVHQLQWTEAEQCMGKMVRIKDLPEDMVLSLHRVGTSTSSTDATSNATSNATASPSYTYLVTNAREPMRTEEVERESGYRWKIEQVHREEKQLTGIEQCQCRRRACQRTHITAAIMVWNCLKIHVQSLNKTVYQLKKDLLAAYLRAQLANPEVRFA